MSREKIIRQIAQRIYENRAKLKILGATEEERKALELQDWFKAVYEYENYWDKNGG